MKLPFLFVVALSAVTVQADLTCLEWGLISPIVGIFCHFEPEYFQEAENNTVAAVEDVVQSAENLVKFDITHNPVAVTYNFLEATNQGGLPEGVGYLQGVGKDFGDVTIGFGKETANQIVNIYELTYWNDVSMCLISGAGRLALDSKRRMGKRAGVPSANEAVSMAQSCISDKLKLIAKPAVFQISDTNQQIGSTISDIAALLTPVSIEEGVTAEAADALEGAVDLAIPGSESTTRVVKMVGDNNNAADHFASELEAQAAADNMRDQSWVDKNCGLCSLPPAIAKRRRRSGYGLNRRGNILTSCCRVPAAISDIDMETADTVSLEEEAQDPVHNPIDYNLIGEADLVPAPQYAIRDISIAADVQALSQDLDTLSTGVVKWFPELTATMSSDELLSTLRKVFTGPSTDPLYQSLQVYERDGGLRMSSFSNQWIDSENPIIQPLQDFVDAAVAQGKDIVAALKGMNAEDAQYLDGNVEFFYTAPTEKALTGTDPRGFHTDGGMMQLGVADVPGLIIRNSAQGTASRVPLAQNAFYAIKANFWDVQAWFQDLPQGPTWHSVFGPEMASEGRVSMIMSIFVKGNPL